MSGLLRRLTRRRPATADENVPPTATSSEPAAAPPETPAEAGGQPPVPAEAGGPQATPDGDPQPEAADRSPTAERPQPTPTEQPTVVLPDDRAARPPHNAAGLDDRRRPADRLRRAAGTARDLPAGVDPVELATAPPASARRGKLRRRLRYLQHVRGLLLRDLGGFTYEIHRTAAGAVQEPQRRLTEAKAQRISALDAEVLALESRLGEPHAETLLREPGIGGTCHECGELHASDAHFCSRCGAPLDEQARAKRAAEQPSHGFPRGGRAAAGQRALGGRPAAGARRRGERGCAGAALGSDEPVARRRPADDLQPRGAAGRAGGEARRSEAGRARGKDRRAEAGRARGKDRRAEAGRAREAKTRDEPKPDEPRERATTARAAMAPDEPARITGETAPISRRRRRRRGPRRPRRGPSRSRASREARDAGEAAGHQGRDAQPAEPEDATAAGQAEPRDAAAAGHRARGRDAGARGAEATSDEAQPERRDFGANGRRDEEIPPPTTSGDPLASRRERRS